jgi:hypothetical protein
MPTRASRDRRPAFGKSRYAEGLVVASGLAPVYIATATAGDDEMASGSLHRTRRGAAWRTIEAPLDAPMALARGGEGRAAVLVDCLTVWLSNLMAAERDVDREVESLVVALADAGPWSGLERGRPRHRARQRARPPLRRRTRHSQPARRGRSTASFLWPPACRSCSSRTTDHGSNHMNAQPPRIPATIVTGFLGAGKTTLIRNLIAQARGRRIAMHRQRVRRHGLRRLAACRLRRPTAGRTRIVELTNGCICCTVADEFLPTMEALLARDPAPDHIVIETSGLALPQPLVRAFSWPSVKHRVTVDGVVTVVDAAAVAAGRLRARPGRDPGGARRRPGGRTRRSDRGTARGPASLRRPRRGEQGRSRRPERVLTEVIVLARRGPDAGWRARAAATSLPRCCWAS